MGNGGVYGGGTPTMGMNNAYSQGQSPSMGGLGLNLEGGLYKNDFGNQGMLNVGQHIINMNMQQQINLNNNQNINNLFSHPSEENYTKNYKQYNLTDQNDFRGRKGYGMKSSESYGRGKKYTPFSVKDYKELSKTHNYTVGGLGANMNDEWENKKKKAEKVREYSDVIKDMNCEKINNQMPKKMEPVKVCSNRDKMMEFAKNVPKPKAKSDFMGGADAGPGGKNNKNNPKLDTEIKMLEGHLEELEMQHQYYQNKIMNINK